MRQSYQVRLSGSTPHRPAQRSLTRLSPPVWHTSFVTSSGGSRPSLNFCWCGQDWCSSWWAPQRLCPGSDPARPPSQPCRSWFSWSWWLTVLRHWSFRFFPAGSFVRSRSRLPWLLDLSSWTTCTPLPPQGSYLSLSFSSRFFRLTWDSTQVLSNDGLAWIVLRKIWHRYNCYLFMRSLRMILFLSICLCASFFNCLILVFDSGSLYFLSIWLSRSFSSIISFLVEKNIPRWIFSGCRPPVWCSTPHLFQFVVEWRRFSAWPVVFWSCSPRKIYRSRLCDGGDLFVSRRPWFPSDRINI